MSNISSTYTLTKDFDGDGTTDTATFTVTLNNQNVSDRKPEHAGKITGKIAYGDGKIQDLGTKVLDGNVANAFAFDGVHGAASGKFKVDAGLNGAPTVRFDGTKWTDKSSGEDSAFFPDIKKLGFYANPVHADFTTVKQ